MVKMLPRDFLYGIIIFTILSGSIVGIMLEASKGSLGDTGNPDLISESEVYGFNETFNVREEVIASTDELRDDISKLRIENPAGLITLSLALINTAWDMIILVIASLNLVNGAIEGLSTYLGVPFWIPVLIIAMIIILFVFSILSMVFGKDI